MILGGSVISRIIYGLFLLHVFFIHAGAQDSHFDDSVYEDLSPTAALDSTIGIYCRAISPDSIKSYIEQLTAFKTRFMLADNRKNIADWLAHKFRSFGYDIIALDSFQNSIEWPMQSGGFDTSWQYNVAATLPGRVSTDSVCVLGAHYDCMIMGPGTDPYKYAPGANNNASGVAVCLEIARIIRQSGFAPKYSIDFAAFGSEEFMTMFESGHSGSQNYIEKLQRENRTAVLMIDNNQVSFAPDTAAWTLDFQNYPGSGELTSLAHDICEKYTKIIPVESDDHIMFTDARYFHEAGYPAIFFEEYYFNPFTFTDQDIPANCNFEYCAEVARISCGILIFTNY